jgi:DNA polymerase III subunit chi
VRVDFYQLGAAPLEQVIASLAEKLLKAGERLLVLSADNAQLARLDRMLWDQGATSFLPHAVAGGGDDSRQPILLSADADASNRARNLLVADGQWREAALAFDRAFYLFDQHTLDQAREAWRSLAGSDEVERHHWANENGRWTEKAAARQSP